MIADMHCDTISVIREARAAGNAVRLRDSPELDVNLTKMRAGDYAVQNFAVFVNMASGKDPFEDAMELVELFEAEMQANEDWIRPVTTAREIGENYREGRLSAFLSLEEGGMCEGEVEKLEELYRHGARMMSLTWNYENVLASPATPMEFGEEDPRSGKPDPGLPGLKKAGEQIVEAMESLGMIPDVSHLSDAGFYDVSEICRGPFAASHSNARALCCHGRNLSDDMLHVLGEHGGVAGLNLCPKFLSETPGSQDILTLLADHAVHMVNHAGSASVGLGTDFDGFSADPVPAGADHMEDLTWAFHRAGLSDDVIDGILSANVLRMYREVLS